MTVSATYGVPFQMSIHVERSTRPATFLIDRAGVLRREYRASSFGDRPSTADIREALASLDEPAATDD